MANAKLPPRQMMINMMYLVLTAMLAMNVSKEVLDQFAVLDADLVRTAHAHDARSLSDYQRLAASAESVPDKFTVPHIKAMRMKARADSLVHRIEAIKTTLIAQADGIAPASLIGPNADGKDTLRSLMAVDAKDDRDVLTHALVGSEPSTPIRTANSAYDIKVQLSAFRDSLKGFLPPNDLVARNGLDMLFDLNDRRDASGTMNNWESNNFYDVPLAAGIATLSKLQADIRSAENDMVKWLIRSAQEGEYSFGTLTTAVIPLTNTVMVGDSFRADVFLAAYDPKNTPTVTVTGGNELPVGADGKAKLRLRGESIGEQIVEGMIKFQGPNGPEEIPYRTSYQVMAPLLVASPTKMNVLYRGVDNPIELSVPGVAADKVQATISTGRIARIGQGWVATGMSGNSAEVNAVVAMPDGSSRRIGPVVFRVKDLPPPTAYIGGTTAGDPAVSKAKLTASQGVIARPLNSEFGDLWVVKSFQFTLMRGAQNPKLETSSSNAFTGDMKTILNDLRPNDKILIEHIKGQLANGQGPVRDLGPITVKVLP